MKINLTFVKKENDDSSVFFIFDRDSKYVSTGIGAIHPYLWAVNKSDGSIMKCCMTYSYDYLRACNNNDMACYGNKTVNVYIKHGINHESYKGSSDIVLYTTYIEAYNALNRLNKEKQKNMKNDKKTIADNLKDFYSTAKSENNKSIDDIDQQMNINSIANESLSISTSNKEASLKTINGSYYINNIIVNFETYKKARMIFMAGGLPNAIINSINDVYNEYAEHYEQQIREREYKEKLNALENELHKTADKIEQLKKQYNKDI